VSVDEEQRETELQKALKQSSWPDMDEGALPSSYINKVQTCLDKRVTKLNDLKTRYTLISVPSALQKSRPAWYSIVSLFTVVCV
jgi:hypothetical protein